jgi:hypothetical protein
MSEARPSNENSRDKVVFESHFGLPGDLRGAFHIARNHSVDVYADPTHAAMDRWIQCAEHLWEQAPHAYCDSSLIGSISLGTSLLNDYEMNSFTNSGELPSQIDTSTLNAQGVFEPTDAVERLMSSVQDYLAQPINLTRFNWYVLEQIRVSTALFEATYRRDAWALRTLLQEPFSFEYGIVAEAALFAAIAVAEVIAPSQSKVKVEDLLRGTTYPESIINVPDAIRDGVVW